MPIQRDLGFMSVETLTQLEGLIDVDGELSGLPSHCAVCRIATLEALGSAVFGPVHEEETAFSLCERCEAQGLLGVLGRRREVMRRLCNEALGGERIANVTRMAAALAREAASGKVTRKRRWLQLWSTSTCGCSLPVPHWPALLEVLLGHEPLNARLKAPPEAGSLYGQPDSLLYFAVAKADTSAVRLIAALSGASPNGRYEPQPLQHALARLLSPPSSKQQLELLRRLSPLSPQLPARSKFEAFLAGSSARFDMRAVEGEDTPLHVAAYRYDAHSLISMMLTAGVDVNALDDRGYAPLHRAADASDQLLGLVATFSEPPSTLEPWLTRRTSTGLRMAADHEQVHALPAPAVHPPDPRTYQPSTNLPPSIAQHRPASRHSSTYTHPPPMTCMHVPLSRRNRPPSSVSSLRLRLGWCGFYFRSVRIAACRHRRRVPLRYISLLDRVRKLLCSRCSRPAPPSTRATISASHRCILPAQRAMRMCVWSCCAPALMAR